MSEVRRKGKRRVAGDPWKDSSASMVQGFESIRHSCSNQLAKLVNGKVYFNLNIIEKGRAVGCEMENSPTSTRAACKCGCS